MLVLAGRNLKSLEHQVIPNAESIHTLDLTANSLKVGAELKQFESLINLVIDNNEYCFLDDFPTLPNLETFSANKNQFSSLSSFLGFAKKKFPKLKHLSLVKNPICPYFEGGKAYESYKTTVMSTFPELETLDGGYVGKQGMKINIESKKTTSTKAKQPEKVVEEDTKMQESVHASKKENKGYKIKDTEDDDEQLDGDDDDQANEKRLLSVIEYNEKYMNKPQRNMKLRSEGNRFVRNDQL